MAGVVIDLDYLFSRLRHAAYEAVMKIIRLFPVHISVGYCGGRHWIHRQRSGGYISQMLEENRKVLRTRRGYGRLCARGGFTSLSVLLGCDQVKCSTEFK